MPVSLRILIRQKLFPLFVLCAGVVAVAALLAVLFGGRQPLTTALDMGISVLRLTLPVLLVLWVQDVLFREFERKTYCSTLTYPHSRAGWLLRRFTVLVLVVFVVLLAIAALLALLIYFFSVFLAQSESISLGLPYWLAMAFMAVDFLVLLAVAVFLAIVASTPSFVLLGTLGFMLIARTYAAIIALLTANAGVVVHADSYRANLGLLGYLLPDLGALDVRTVALYGRMDFLPADWPVLLVSALAYVFGFLGLAVWALQRKRFA